jgi:hypothetical protein
MHAMPVSYIASAECVDLGFVMSKLRSKAVFGLCAAAAFFAPGLSSTVEAAEIKTEFSISFAGVPVARSSFTTIVDGDALSVRGNLSTAGLASVFSATKATSVSSGRITETGVQTQSFKLDYKSGKRSRSTSIAFKGGNVTNLTVTPAREPNPNIIPVEPSHMKGVVDPFFASLVRASSPADVCNRTIKVFDGVSRSNLVMRAAGSEPYRLAGRMIDGVRCAVRYEPISGHRGNSSGVRYMSEAERATILFAPLEGTSLYGPVKASIKTKNGTITIRATKFSVSGS